MADKLKTILKKTTTLSDNSFSGPEVIFLCSAELNIKISPLINIKMPTNVAILIIFKLRKFILSLSEGDGSSSK